MSTQPAPQEPQTSDSRTPPDVKRRQEEWQQRDIHEKSAASAETVYKAILLEANEELVRPSLALAWSGLAAGLSMGFSLVTEGLIQTHLPEANWTKLVANFGYTVGFVILILGRQQLFTENTLTPVLSLLRHRDVSTFVNTARLWAILLVSNLVGAVIFAYFVNRTSTFTPEAHAAFLKIASESMEPPRLTLFFKSIFAGWLIAIMVWMLPVAETGRIWVLIIVPYIVGLGHLSHIIIGSIYCFYTIFAGHASWAEYFSHFFWPVLLGNCIGGVALVAIVNHQQATAGGEED
jgi:formate/nitrite transporter FocA (FNT family)